MPQKEKVAVGLSGGVDSALTAKLLMDEGHDVIGVTMYLFDELDDGVPTRPAFIDDARRVADTLEISHHVIDLREDFSELVLDPFMKMYLSGQTPNPCAICNPTIKYGRFLDACLDLGATRIATGHYARISFNPASGRHELYKGAVRRKDQSYVLHSLKQHQLSRILLPLSGETDKENTRSQVSRFMPSIGRKKDSLGICFAGGKSHGDFIKGRLPGMVREGDFLSMEGDRLGTHRGIVYYTVGQKSGLEKSLGRNYYVHSINPDDNSVTLTSDESDLDCSHLSLKDFNYIPSSMIPSEIYSTVRIFQWGYDINALVSISHDGLSAEVKFDSPQRAPAIGQCCVIYDGDRVIGGGTITGKRK